MPPRKLQASIEVEAAQAEAHSTSRPGWSETGVAGIHVLPVPSLPRSVNGSLKRVVDVVGAVALALVFSPLILGIAVWIRSSSSPAIYGHRRVGQNGRLFQCLKFRTMVPDAERVLKELLEQSPALKAEWMRDHKLRNDPRVTQLGAFLRRTSLDELPQLWNVFRGEMSLVGPRPVVWDELSKYGRRVTTYLAAKPGITGLWQVNGRSDTSYRRRVAMDVYYARNHSLLLDAQILLQTTRVVVFGHGAY